MTAPNITRYSVESACREGLSRYFNTISQMRVCADYVPLYTPDWDNLENDDFLNNAAFYGVHCLLSEKLPATPHGTASSITLTPDDQDQSLRMVALTYRHDGDTHDQRLQDALAYARQWRGQQTGDFSEPRLIILPSIKERVLWLSGANNVIIPVDHFHTKPNDPIAVDVHYIKNLRVLIEQQNRMYEEMRKQHGDDADLLGGGGGGAKPPRLRPPGG